MDFDSTRHSIELSLLLRLFSVSEKEFARAIGVQPALVRRWLNGAKPQQRNRDAINAYFGIILGMRTGVII